jgi:glyoxylase-like metal-dependent hydrolase (beta-lactamase superfamily II)
MIRNSLALSALCLGLSTLSGCVTTGHPVVPAAIGAQSSAAKLESVVTTPGPVEVETIAAAEWKVPRAGLINLDHPRARAAGLEDGDEPVTIYFHALRHPTRGLFIVDSGVERALHGDPDNSLVRGIVRSAVNADAIEVKVDLASWLARQPQPLSGVFLTHLHLDHVLGLPDVPRGTPIYVGRGEARAGGILNAFTRPTTDRALNGHSAVQEWQFEPDPSGRFAGVLDVLGDASIFAVHVPGHTPGSTAFVVRTPKGPVLLTGDACHTEFGWNHGVEPGTFSSDQPESRKSLASLEAFARRHPELEVRLGHQERHAHRAAN